MAKFPGVSERSWTEAIAGIYARPPGSRPPLRTGQCPVGNAPAAGKSPAGRARSLCYTAAACLAAVNVFAMARAGCLQLHVPIKHQNKSKVWTIHPLNDQGSARTTRVDSEKVILFNPVVAAVREGNGPDEGRVADALNLYFLSRNVPAVG